MLYIAPLFLAFCGLVNFILLLIKNLFHKLILKKMSSFWLPGQSAKVGGAAAEADYFEVKTLPLINVNLKNKIGY